ncbi:MAG: ATP-binding cassette domain-containing protein, partial [Alphaproteobacteria bacterium]|nr:ATP-binding cassette domain-containing protein [Alphaproteobacteria bacterium]
MLELRGIDTFYGRSQVLFGMELEVGTGQVASLMGRNGMGKTTTVRTIMGLVRPAAGSVRFDGRELTEQPAYRIAQLGLGLVPEGRQIFPNLTVRENLVATASKGQGSEPWTLPRVYHLFPRLEERQRSMGDQLSGGEQQML